MALIRHIPCLQQQWSRFDLVCAAQGLSYGSSSCQMLAPVTAPAAVAIVPSNETLG